MVHVVEMGNVMREHQQFVDAIQGIKEMIVQVMMKKIPLFLKVRGINLKDRVRIQDKKG